MSPIAIAITIFLGFTFGWVFGRRHDRKKETRRSAERAKRYFKGLGYALSDQPDKAIDAFVELMKIDDDTVETHFALATLYRKRGETERAIRIHQAIVARALLPDSHRAHASYELGLDYSSAGLLDRAESIFLEMQRDDLYRRSCLRELLALYQKTQEWDKAAEIADRLQNEGVDDAKPALAHFYCELAENLAQAQKFDQALAKAEYAQQLDDHCIRAFLIAIRLHIQTGQRELALKRLHEIIQHDAGLFSESLPYVLQLQLSPAELQSLLTQALQQGAGASVVVALADSVLQTEGDRAAGDVLVQALKTRPSLRELQRLVELYLPQVQGSTRAQLQLLHDVLQTLLDRLPIYRCQNCGFAGKKMHWRCPSCKRWNTVRPVMGVEGE